MGLQFLQGIGGDAVCKVCISNGGSCCYDCTHLMDGEGCQNRNTSCTAWLCGLQKFLLHEVDLLSEWNQFWKKIPGLDFRQDDTPAYFFVEKELAIPDIPWVGESFAKDLDMIFRQPKPLERINDLKTELNICIELISNKGTADVSERIYQRLNGKKAMYKNLQGSLEKMKSVENKSNNG